MFGSKKIKKLEDDLARKGFENHMLRFHLFLLETRFEKMCQASCNCDNEKSKTDAVH